LLSYILLLLILIYIRILAIAPRFLETTNRKDADYANKHRKTGVVVRFLMISRIGFIIRLLLYVGLFIGVFFSILSSPPYDVSPFSDLLLYLIFGVPIVILELRFASHKKRSGPFPVVYYKLQSEISRRDLVIALDHTVCSDGAWKSESGLQADTPHFWINISTGERIFLLITPFRPPIIALGHMGIQGLRLRTTHSVRDAFVRAELAIMSFSGTKIPAYEIPSLLGSVQEQQVQHMKMFNELERLSQLKMIKQCPKCGEWVRDESAVIECPLCLYHFDTTNDLQQQKRKDAIQQQIQWVSRPIGVNAGSQAPVRALPPRALSS
jgi:hypothetical protein